MDHLRDGGRRRFLQAAAAAAVLGGFSAPAWAAPRVPHKRIVALHNLHTGENVSAVYWSEGRYQQDALRRINWLLRDHRTGDVHPIDPRLLDLLTSLRSHLNTREPVQVICGYRSPATNAMLEGTTEGVAHNSFHVHGKAIDIRVPGRRLAGVRQAAVKLRVGGVGYYPRSDFVHVDVGPVRHW